MKQFSIFCFVLIFFSCQKTPQYQKIVEENIDFQNYLKKEGGGEIIILDTITPLSVLIEKLNDNWDFVETGKMYWIGYTNDMFSIASYKNEAIPLLLDFFQTTNSEKGKFGVLYTLHLIGINGHIAGRMFEEFINSNARNALLELLKNKKYTYTIMTLLIRDPWKSDIPYLFEILGTEKDNDIVWPNINSLVRYKIENLPVSNIVPDSINALAVKMIVKDSQVLEPNFDFDSQIKEALKLFENKFSKTITVEKELYRQEISEYYSTKLSGDLPISEFLCSLKIAQNDMSKYLDIGCKIQYYVKDNILFFVTIETARKLLNDWWLRLPKEEK